MQDREPRTKDVERAIESQSAQSGRSAFLEVLWYRRRDAWRISRDQWMLLLLIVSNAMLPFLASVYIHRSAPLEEGAVWLGTLVAAGVAVGAVYWYVGRIGESEARRSPAFVAKIVAIALVPNCTGTTCVGVLSKRLGEGFSGILFVAFLVLPLALHLTMAMVLFSGRRRAIAATAVLAWLVGLVSLFVAYFLWFVLCRLLFY